jgi:hypothetical protein
MIDRITGFVGMLFTVTIIILSVLYGVKVENYKSLMESYKDLDTQLTEAKEEVDSLRRKINNKLIDTQKISKQLNRCSYCGAKPQIICGRSTGIQIFNDSVYIVECLNNDCSVKDNTWGYIQNKVTDPILISVVKAWNNLMKHPIIKPIKCKFCKNFPEVYYHEGDTEESSYRLKCTGDRCSMTSNCLLKYEAAVKQWNLLMR